MKKFLSLSLVGALLVAGIVFGSVAHADNGFTRLTQVSGSIIVTGGTTTVNLTNFPPVDAGFVLAIGIVPSTVTVTSVTGGGVTWVKAIQSTNQRDAEIWYGVGSNGSSKTISIKTSAAGGTAYFNLSEWSGMATSSPVDVTAASSGTSTTLPTGSITTANGNDLIIAMERNGTNVGGFGGGPSNGFSALASGHPDVYNAGSLTTVSTGTFSTSWTQGSSVPYETLIAAFKHQ